MTDGEATPIFERGDVVYGDDPFKGAGAARPWLVLSNHEGHPFHGEQYIALTLTSKSWMDGLIDIPEESWLRGGTPDESWIVPWSVQSIAKTSTSGKAVWGVISSTEQSLRSSKNYSSGSSNDLVRRIESLCVVPTSPRSPRRDPNAAPARGRCPEPNRRCAKVLPVTSQG